MSPLRMGGAKAPVVSGAQLTAASDALDAALRAGGEQFPAALRERTGALATKVRERTSIAGDRTVVALAGATGSGKSTLFNAIVGAEVARTGVLRPTTATPTAAIWGDEPAGELLDWLGVGHRHHVVGGPQPQLGSLDGLVLLDLPDFDSREESNRLEAERVLELCDVFCWVTDPQKYADARLHDDYVRTLAHHDAVTVVVLNQVDRLTPQGVASCIDDLHRLMERDGLPDATVLPVSARTGQGVPELVQRLASSVAGAGAARTRLAGDIRTTATALQHHLAAAEPSVQAGPELVDALARSAGVPTVVAAVERDHRMDAIGHTGWPFTRWMQSVRARPLRRLRLDRDLVTVTEHDVRSELGRSSLPPPTPAARAAVSLATQRVVDAASVGMPPPWADALADAASPHDDRLADSLDQAIVGTPLRSRTPVWWRAMGVLQFLLVICVVAGALWLLGRWGLTLLGFNAADLPLPTIGIVPLPAILLVGGVLLGVLLAMLSRVLAGIGARRRAAAVDADLRAAIAGVAEQRILGPVGEVLDRHREARLALDKAHRLEV